jgi:hypothetical protein
MYKIKELDIMDDYDTFYSVEYRGVMIHAKRNRTPGREEFTIQGWPTIPLLSLRSAKSRVTRIIGRGRRL